MIGLSKKAYLQKPIKILQFLSFGKIQNILAFSTVHHLQAELHK